MSVFRRKKERDHPPAEWKIKKECLDLIIECAKSSYPNEFGGLLRVDAISKKTITEVVILPGTISGDSHAIFRLHMLPIDFSIVGTVHSHPTPNARPSKADLALFNKYGKIHIIAASPFNQFSWKTYDYAGYEIDIAII
ncbi:MAG: Mov34/MPN/PAD-1 family protein [Thermoplasmatales archaeon]|nr:MAG: Mov34/MPN/PAD-1 family protein [Thermoplasmatales archaeon]